MPERVDATGWSKMTRGYGQGGPKWIAESMAVLANSSLIIEQIEPRPAGKNMVVHFFVL